MKEFDKEEVKDLVRKHYALKEIEPENKMFRYMKSSEDGTEVIFSGTLEDAGRFLELFNAFFPSRKDLSRVKGRVIGKEEYCTRISIYLLRQYSRGLDRELLRIDNKILKDWELDEE